MSTWQDLKGTTITLFGFGKNNSVFDSSPATVQRIFTLPDASVDMSAGTVGQVLSKLTATTIGWANAGGGGGVILRGFGIDGFATLGTFKALPILIPSAKTIQSIKAYARTAPVGDDLIFDINKNGVSIFTTPGDRLQIADGANISTVGAFSTALAANDVLELDIDQIGISVLGKDITIVIELI